jgi:hypothetical protein
VVATTHKGSLACAASGAGQGQVAPRGCKTHGLDDRRLDLDLAYLTSGNKQSTLPSLQCAAIKEMADSEERNVVPSGATWRGNWEGAKRGNRSNRREGRKTRQIDVRNTAVFAVFSAAKILPSHAAARAHLVRSDGQRLGALYDRCSQPAQAR